MQKTVKITYSVNSSESGMPTGHRKLEKLSELLGSYRKVIEKLSASFRKLADNFCSSGTGLRSRQIIMVTIQSHEWLVER